MKRVLSFLSVAIVIVVTSVSAFAAEVGTGEVRWANLRGGDAQAIRVSGVTDDGLRTSLSARVHRSMAPLPMDPNLVGMLRYLGYNY